MTNGERHHKSPLRLFSASSAQTLGAPQGFALLNHTLQDPVYSWASRPVQRNQKQNCQPADQGLLAGILQLLGARDAYFAASQPMPPQSIPCGKAIRQAALTHALEGAEANGKSMQQQTAEAAALLDLMAANQRPWMIRLFGYVLTHVFRWLYGSCILVDEQSLRQLHQLHQTHAIVYVCTHKTHFDYLMASYVLFTAGLPCPHIAAGDNLRIPVVQLLLRGAGAFFIRRDNQGRADAAAYRRVFAGYITAVLEAGAPLEMFIEGGRSRDGRILPPKQGLLSLILDAVLDADLPKKVALVPCAISYDTVLEEGSLAAELTGIPKRGESLFGLLSTAARLVVRAVTGWGSHSTARGSCGRAIVSFGDPVRVDSFLKARVETFGLSLQQRIQHGKRRASGSLGEAELNMLLFAALEDRRPGTQPSPPGLLDLTFDKGSTARRVAVTALGHELAKRLRACHVVPASVLLAAAVHFLRVAQPVSSPASTSPGPEDQLLLAMQPAPAGKRATTSSGGKGPDPGGTALEEGLLSWDCGQLAGQVAWLSGELSARGYLCESLPSGKPAALATAQLAHPLAGLLRLKAGQERVSLVGGVGGSLAMQYRLNQLLPAFAAEGLLASALLSCAGPRGGPADQGEVLAAALWLREVLCEQVDCATGPSSLRSVEEFAAVAEALTVRGVILRTGEALRLAKPSKNNSTRVARFAASLLAPLVESYAISVETACEVLGHGNEAATATVAELASAVEHNLLRHSQVPASLGKSHVVPSVLLAKGSIFALKRLGVLEPAPHTLARPVESIDRLPSTPDKSTTFDGAVDRDTAGPRNALAVGSSPTKDHRLALEAPQAARVLKKLHSYLPYREWDTHLH